MNHIQACVKSLLAALSVSSLLLLSACDQPEAEAPVVRPVMAMKVADAASFGGRSFPGRARAIQEANLSFDVSGTLNKRPVKVGDKVVKGQLLASIDPRDFQSKLKAAKAERIRASANFKRGKELIKEKHISESEFDKLQAAFQVASANEETARKALSDTQLKAPFDGRISELFVKNFVSVNAKQEIARLVDNTKIEMVIDIPEKLISYVPLVSHVVVRFDAFQQHDIKALIKEVGTEASEITRTYPVTVVMEQPEDFRILAGMAGEARVDQSKVSEDLLKENRSIHIPLSSVFSQDSSDKQFVWVINEQSSIVKRREIATGAIRSSGIIVKSGLTPGEWIAVAGVNMLREEQKVRLLPVEGE